MSHELLDALGQIAREKSVDRQVLIETLEAGLLSAAKKKFGANSTIRVQLDEAQGSLRVFTDRAVVAEVSDAGIEISLEDARDYQANIRMGETLAIELSMEDFGRNAIQAAKQVLIQRVREAERDRVYNEFQGRVGELVHAVVQQVDRGTAIVKLERAEAVVPQREQMPRDRFRQGEHIRALLLSVEKATKGPQVVLSRTHPDFLRRLFEQEVPEIGEKIVEIKNVAREPGQRSKISVESHDERVDPVGACVGVKGQRVQAIVRELGGERIDIVPWSADPLVFVSRALSPAKVIEAKLEDRERKIEVIVADDQLSLAIGKGGQNARLAAKLTGFKIDLVSQSEQARHEEEEKALRIEIVNVPRIGPKLAERLAEAGIRTVSDLVETPLQKLAELPGLDERTAIKLLDLANVALEEAAARFAAEQASQEEPPEGEETAEADSPEPVSESEAGDEGTETMDQEPPGADAGAPDAPAAGPEGPRGPAAQSGGVSSREGVIP
jgi:N utilization substance protein A